MNPTRMVRLALPLTCAAVLGVLATSPAVDGQNDETGRKFAVLVAVKNYKRTELNNLQYTENDVTALAEVLQGAGYRRVVLLTQTTGAREANFAPTAKNIRAELKGVLETCREHDAVVVAFSGHGVQFRGDDEHYFCPSDAALGDRTTLIGLTEVYASLKSCKARQKLLLVDACRNDPQAELSKSAGGPTVESVTRPQVVKPPEGVAALFSCSTGQRSWESKDLNHGLFFHAVLQGLRGKAANRAGDVTLAGLVRYVEDEVPVLAKEYIDRDVSQVPEPRLELRGSMTLLSLKDSRGIAGGDRPPPTPPIDDRKEFTNSIGMKLVLIPAGEFMMGSPTTEADRYGEEHQHRVKITRPFFMGIHEVTQDQYERVTGSNPSRFQGSDLPVENVSWDDAQEFCKKLGTRDGRTYRLPTEAEWEYACRAGTTTAFHYGDSLSSRQANFNGSFPYGSAAKETYRQKTTKVGSFAPNKFGVYDMHGNVWEWCQDWCDENYYKNSPVEDPQGPTAGSYRVLRGGSWFSNGLNCRSADRSRGSPDYRSYGLGFRVVVSVR